MALSLFLSPPPTSPPASLGKEGTLHLLAGYEDGRVALFHFSGPRSAAFDPPTSHREEGENWDLAWEEKGHREARASLLLALV